MYIIKYYYYFYKIIYLIEVKLFEDVCQNSLEWCKVNLWKQRPYSSHILVKLSSPRFSRIIITKRII